MFLRKKEGADTVFQCGKIKELLEKMSFISDLGEGEGKRSQAECVEIRKLANSLRYEIRSCKATWGEGSNLETALGDVLHVLDCISSPGKIRLTDMDAGYAYMGRIQGMFFVKNKISGHCPEKYGEAMKFFAEEKEHMENALAMEKRTLAELAYDKVANGEAMRAANARIERHTQHIHILNDMLQGTQYMMLQAEHEAPEAEDCDAAAEAEGADTGIFPVLLAEETQQPLSIYSEPQELPEPDALEISESLQELEIPARECPEEEPELPAGEPMRVEEAECPGEEPESPGEPEAETESEEITKTEAPGILDARENTSKGKDARSTRFLTVPDFFHRKKGQTRQPQEKKRLAEPVGEAMLSIKEKRMVLYAPGRCLFLTKKGTFIYGREDHIDNRTYRNRDRSAYVLQISRTVYDLLTVRYDAAFYADIKAGDLADSRKVMQWIYEHSMGNGESLPFQQYVDYQAYYSQCAEQFLDSREKERKKRLQAELTAGGIAELAVLYGRVKPEGLHAARESYASQLFGGETEQLLKLLEELAAKDIPDGKLKKQVQGFTAQLGCAGAGQAEMPQSAGGKEEPFYAAAHYGVYPDVGNPAARPDVCPGTGAAEGEAFRREFFDEVRNMRLLLKKEDINGDMQIKAASLKHMSYLVKQFYIMLSYSKELGIDYKGQHIWLIRYDNERRAPIPAMSAYEKHVRRLDQGKTGMTVRYMEQKYQSLLEMYAGMNE